MTVSSRSDGRLRLRIASLLLSMALASSAMAQDSNEVARLAEEARQAFLSAEQTGVSPRQKAGFYQVARARVMLLEKFAGQDNAGLAELREGARSELKRLADEGLSHDMLGSFLLQASLGDITSTASGADRVEIGISLHQVASEQRSAAYRAAAFVELGYAYAKAGAQDRALRYAALAVEEGSRIPELGTRAGSYKAVARLVTSLGASGLELADRAISLIPQARDRAYARHELARVQLKGSVWEKVPDAKIALEAKRRLEGGDLAGSLSMALALIDSKEREKLLSDLLEAANSRQDTRNALLAAQGFIDQSRQEKAIGVIVKNYADRGVPLQASEVLNTLQNSPGKASIQFDLSATMRQAGYDRMADQLVSTALDYIGTLSDVHQRLILPNVVQGLARSDRLDEALRYAERLEAGVEASPALSDLAARLADRNRLTDAESLLMRIVAKEHRSHALSGIACAKARAGDIAGAMQIIPELVEAKDTGRAISAVVLAQSEIGKFDQAILMAGRIDDEEVKLHAFSGILKQAARKGNSGIVDIVLSEVIKTIETKDAGSRDKLLLSIIASVPTSNHRADELIQRIQDDGIRNRAKDVVVAAEARALITQRKREEIPDALLKRGIDRVKNDEDKADLALELASFSEGGIYAADLIRSIQDDRARRAAFRRMAEMRADVLRAPLRDESGTDEVEEVETVSSVSEEPVETAQEIQTRRGLKLITADAKRPVRTGAEMPKSFLTAAAVRSGTPWPGGAVVGSTFANHNPYIAKFFEDDEVGATRLEQAIRYQGLSSPRVLVVQSGVATLGMIARQLQGTDARDLIAYDAGSVTVRAPILVAPGATLILSRLDSPVYRLSADAGAFVVNAGTVQIVDAEIVGFEEKSGQPQWAGSDQVAAFRPFLLTWGDGRMDVASSVLTALGYDNAKSFGLSYSSGPEHVAELRDQARPAGMIVDNVFRNSYYGIHSYEAERIQVVGNEFRDSIVYAVDSHDRTHEITIAFNAIYGTMLRHGITVSRDVGDSRIIGNISFDNAGSGIVLDRNSTNNIVHANSSFRNTQDGVTVFESSCNILTNNYLASNKRDGLKVRNSFDVGAYANRIEANANSGVSAYIANILTGKSGEGQSADAAGYAPVTSLSLKHNRFSANGVGINTQGVSGLAMFSNRFVKQSRRLLGGDIRGLEGQVLRLTPQSDVLLASACRPAKPVSSCRLRDQGLFDGDSELQVFNPQGGSNCTDVSGSVQHRAFSSSSQGT